MPYVGKTPTVGNFVKLDAITTSATATYNLLNGGVAYSPQSPNHCIVSLNGVIQSPTTSFTISGSTIVFASALTASDVIDFILVLGDVLNIGTPSDATVGFAKVTSNLITGATAETSIAGDDSILIYDDSATALRKMTKTNLFSGISNTPAFRAVKSNAQTFTSGVTTKIQFNTEIFDTDNCYDPTTNYRFTPNVAGKYFVGVSLRWDSDADWDIASTTILKNGNYAFEIAGSNIRYNNWFAGGIVTMNGTTDYIEAVAGQHSGTDKNNYSDGNEFFAYKLIGV